jgi:two-component system NtrC family sensor kinase
MRLMLKFALAYLLGLIVVLSVYTYFLVRREAEVFADDMRRDDVLIGEVFASALQGIWQLAGPDEAQALVRHANQSESRAQLRWTWLDVPPASPDAPRLPPEQFAALAHGRTVMRAEHPPQGVGQYLTYVPIASAAGRPAALEVAESLVEQQRYVRQTVLHVVATAGTVVAVSGLLALLLGFWLVARPMDRLIGFTQRVAAGDFSSAVELRQHDELHELAQALNVMSRDLAGAHARVAGETAARIAALEQLRHADRLQTVGRLTSGIAHELGTPLNVVWGRAKMIASREVAGDEAADNARVIVEQSARMTKIIRQLLDFSRSRSPKKAAIDLFQVVRQTFALFQTTATKRNVTLLIEGDNTPQPVEVDAGQLQQVLSNLILNAIQAMPAGGPVTVSSERRQAQPPADQPGPAGEYVCLSVCDRGCGIAAEHLPRIFDPFFTTKSAGEGTGLGLSVSLGIIREHGGWIDVESAVGQGTCFRIYLPQRSGSCADAS